MKQHAPGSALLCYNNGRTIIMSGYTSESSVHGVSDDHTSGFIDILVLLLDVLGYLTYTLHMHTHNSSSSSSSSSNTRKWFPLRGERK